MDEEIQSELGKFADNNSVIRVIIKKHTWHYCQIGNGNHTVVLFPSLFSIGEVGPKLNFSIINALRNNFQVISVGYPTSVNTIEEIIDGVKTILDNLKLDNVSLLCTSTGITFAMCFLYKYPVNVNKMIFCDMVNLYWRASEMSYLKTEISLVFFYVVYRFFLSKDLKEKQFRNQMLKRVSMNNVSWIDYLTQVIRGNSFQSIYKKYLFGLNVLKQKWRFAPDNIKWSGDVLIINSANQHHHVKTSGKTEDYFKNAVICTIKDNSPIMWYTNAEDIAKIIIDFFD